MTNVLGFDWEFYLQYNVDVKEIFGYNRYAALLHYIDHGKNEDRVYSDNMLFQRYPFLKSFDWEFYRDNNEDLKELTKYLLLDHYIHQGYKENRRILFSTPIFNYLQFVLPPTIAFKKPLISIIFPVFNRPEYLKESINSIINQTYENWELIIVDDGSNEIVKGLLKTFINPRITILTNDSNYGCYVSINMALGLCNGDYITIHGSDDVSLDNRLLMLINLAVKNNYLMVGNYFLRTHFDTFENIDVNNNLFGQIVTQKLDNITHNGECCKPLVSLGTLMYHKSVFKTIGYYENIRKGGDMVMFEKFLAKYEGILFTELDCSHRYLTKHNKGKTYGTVEEILYLSPEMTSSNITSQNIKFNINDYRRKLHID